LLWSLLSSSAHEKVPEDTARAPKQPISPSLDAAFLLVKDKDLSTSNQLSFVISKPPFHFRHHASCNTLEDDQRIMSARAASCGKMDGISGACDPSDASQWHAIHLHVAFVCGLHWSRHAELVFDIT
jgi:hypothetical protein